MSDEKYLIILKGEDKTKEINSYRLEDSKFIVKFNNSPKEYSYIKSDWIFKNNPVNVDIKDSKISIAEMTIYNIKKLLKFEDYYKVFFKDGTTKLVKSQNLQICKMEDYEKSNDIFNYFKDISEIVSVRTEDGKAILTGEYKKINFIDKSTTLHSYLNQENKTRNNHSNNVLLFPFGSNESQYNAVKKAMENQISIIEGPPGTGKTQTILNIIANIIKNGKTVAVVSNNNEATANVYEKLEKYGFGYICATLGKRENKEKFLADQIGEYPNIERKEIDEYQLKNEIINLNHKLKEVFKLQNEIAKLKESLGQIEVEHKYFLENEHHDVSKISRNTTSSSILRLKLELEDFIKSNIKISLWYKIKMVIFKRIGNFKFYNRPLNEIIKSCEQLYFSLKESEIRKSIDFKTQQLNSLDGKNKLNLLKEKSTIFLNNCMYKKYNFGGTRKVFTSEDLYKKPEEFLIEYPIVFSTTYSIKKCLNNKCQFDYIVIDEASQVDLITGVLALSCAQNAVIVGDTKQLPNVITTENKKEIEQIAKKYYVPNSLDYLTNSLLSSLKSMWTSYPCTQLREHYRCHPKIIGFCNKKFYNNELIIMTEDKNENDVLKVYMTPKGNHARRHFNQREKDIINGEVMSELCQKVDVEEIGIITPYVDQKQALAEGVNKDELQVDTIHKYQGREKEAIIISTVDNEISDFVDNPKMLNVAVTRARRYLRLVVTSNVRNSDGNINDLVRYVKYNNFEVVESKTKSIYDMLYKANRKELLDYLKDKKKVSEFNSENITYNTIQDILIKNKYENLDVVTHVQLSHIFKDLVILTDEEKRFVSNEWTHSDFVIYNKMDKKIFLAIEVDGYHNHIRIKQKNRDELKNRIFEKYNIPLVRLNTVGSGEKTIIENKIKEIMEDEEMGYKNINFERAKHIIDNEQVLILDVRTEEEFITGHIINAINIPVDELEERIDELKDKYEKILVYCKSGTRSVIACEILSSYDYTNIYNIGGLVDWPYGLEM